MSDTRFPWATLGLGVLFVATAMLGATLGALDGEHGMIGARLLLKAFGCE